MPIDPAIPSKPGPAVASLMPKLGKRAETTLNLSLLFAWLCLLLGGFWYLFGAASPSPIAVAESAHAADSVD